MKFKSNKIAQYLYERKSTDGQQYILNHEFYSSGSHKRVKGLLKKKIHWGLKEPFFVFQEYHLVFLSHVHTVVIYDLKGSLSKSSGYTRIKHMKAIQKLLYIYETSSSFHYLKKEVKATHRYLFLIIDTF